MTPSPDQGGPSLSAERVLVERAQRGETDAFGALYDLYLPRVYRYCLGRVGMAVDAEDLAEEVFLKAFRSINKFKWRLSKKSERSPFGSWLFRIAYNDVVSFYRQTARRPAASELTDDIRDGTRGPVKIAEQRFAIEEAFQAVRELPPAQRDVILLRFSAGLSVTETAEALGKQENNVKVLQHKGIKQLRNMLTSVPDRNIESSH